MNKVYFCSVGKKGEGRNARDLRNIFERTLMNQAKRLNLIAEPTNLQLREIQPDDLPDNYN